MSEGDHEVARAFEIVVNNSYRVVFHDLIEVVGNDEQFGQTIIYGLRAGRAPYDVLWTPYDHLGALPFLRNLTQAWVNLGLRADVHPGIAAQTQKESGTWYTIPQAFTFATLMYRPDVLRKANVSMPTSLSELRAVCRTIRERVPEVSSCVAACHDEITFSHWFDYLFVQLHGSQLMRQFLEGYLAFNSDHVHAVLMLMRELIDEGTLNPEATITSFLNGETPFLYDYDAHDPRLANATLLSNVRVSRPLKLTPTSIFVDSLSVSVAGLSVAANSEQPEAACAFAGSYATYADLFWQSGSVGVPAIRGVPVPPHPLRDAMIAISEDVVDMVEWSFNVIKGTQTRRVWITSMLDFFSNELDDSVTFVDAWLDATEAARYEDQHSKAITPVPSILPGTFADPLVITFSTLTSDAEIHVGFGDGFPDSQTSIAGGAAEIHLSRVHQDQDTVWVVQAIATRSDLLPSDPYRGTYTIVAPMPESSPAKPDVNYLPLVLVPLGVVVCSCLIMCALVAYKHAHRVTVLRISDYDHLVINYDDITIETLIGHGASGDVFQGTWKGTRVAVKGLKALNLDSDSESRQEARNERIRRFVNEAALMMQVRHPNVVTIMGVCIDPRLCLITEFMERGTLFDILHNTSDIPTISLVQRVRWCLQIARGMEFLHLSNPPIIHRDLKSLNILLDNTWTAKIADFGISTLSAATVSPLDDGTRLADNPPDSPVSPNLSWSLQSIPVPAPRVLDHRPGKADIGTLLWMAPEVIQDPRLACAKSDVYSFGIVLWEIFSRQHVFRSMMPIAVALAVVRQQLRPSLVMVPQAYYKMVPVMQHCWAQQPSARPTFSDVVRTISKSFASALAGPPAPPSVLSELKRHELAAAANDVLFFVTVSLEPLLANAMESSPAVFCGYMRGLYRFRDDLGINTQSWHESATSITFAFSEISQAVRVVEDLTSARIVCVPSAFSSAFHGHVTLPVAAILPFAITIHGGRVDAVPTPRATPPPPPPSSAPNTHRASIPGSVPASATSDRSKMTFFHHLFRGPTVDQLRDIAQHAVPGNLLLSPWFVKTLHLHGVRSRFFDDNYPAFERTIAVQGHADGFLVTNVVWNPVRSQKAFLRTAFGGAMHDASEKVRRFRASLFDSSPHKRSGSTSSSSDSDTESTTSALSYKTTTSGDDSISSSHQTLVRKRAPASQPIASSEMVSPRSSNMIIASHWTCSAPASRSKNHPHRVSALDAHKAPTPIALPYVSLSASSSSSTSSTSCSSCVSSHHGHSSSDHGNGDNGEEGQMSSSLSATKPVPGRAMLPPSSRRGHRQQHRPPHAYSSRTTVSATSASETSAEEQMEHTLGVARGGMQVSAPVIYRVTEPAPQSPASHAPGSSFASPPYRRHGSRPLPHSPLSGGDETPQMLATNLRDMGGARSANHVSLFRPALQGGVAGPRDIGAMRGSASGVFGRTRSRSRRRSTSMALPISTALRQTRIISSPPPDAAADTAAASLEVRRRELQRSNPSIRGHPASPTWSAGESSGSGKDETRRRLHSAYDPHTSASSRQRSPVALAPHRSFAPPSPQALRLTPESHASAPSPPLSPPGYGAPSSATSRLSGSTPSVWRRECKGGGSLQPIRLDLSQHTGYLLSESLLVPITDYALQHALLTTGTLYASYCVTEVSTNRAMLLRLLLDQPRDPGRMIDFLDMVATLKSLEVRGGRWSVPILGISLAPGACGILVPFMAKGNLSTLTSPAPPLGGDMKRALGLVRSLLQGLVGLEASGLAYKGNLKPSNVFVMEGDQLLLADFGQLDFSTDLGTITLTQPVAYLAPECMLGQTPTATSDVFSFGVIAHEMVTGSTGYPEHLGAMEISVQISLGLRPKISQRLPQWLRQMLRSCFEEPDARPTFRALLQEWRLHMARPASSWRPAQSSQ